MASHANDGGCGNASCMYSASGAYVCAPPTAAQKQQGKEQFVDAAAAAAAKKYPMGVPVQGQGHAATGSFAPEGFYSPAASATSPTPPCSMFPSAMQASLKSAGKCT